MNKMWQNENSLVFPFTAPLSLPIYCLILTSSSLPSHNSRLTSLPPNPPPPSFALVVSSFLRRVGVWMHINRYWECWKKFEKERKSELWEWERGEGSGWRWSPLHSLISCGQQGSQGCTGSFPSAGAWLNSTQLLWQDWTPGSASGRCRTELQVEKLQKQSIM